MEQEETVVATLPTVCEDKSLAEVEMGKEVSSVEKQASQIVISTQTDYESAASFGKYIKQKAQQITDFFAPMKTAAHEAHKNICAREKEMLAPLIQAEKIVKDAMGGFIMEQERKRQAEEEKMIFCGLYERYSAAPKTIFTDAPMISNCATKWNA